MQAVIGVKFIADHMKAQEEDKKVSLTFLTHFFRLTL